MHISTLLPRHHNELPEFATGSSHPQVVETVDVGSNCGAEQEVSFGIAEQWSSGCFVVWFLGNKNLCVSFKKQLIYINLQVNGRRMNIDTKIIIPRYFMFFPVDFHGIWTIWNIKINQA